MKIEAKGLLEPALKASSFVLSLALLWMAWNVQLVTPVTITTPTCQKDEIQGHDLTGGFPSDLMFFKQLQFRKALISK